MSKNQGTPSITRLFCKKCNEFKEVLQNSSRVNNEWICACCTIKKRVQTTHCGGRG